MVLIKLSHVTCLLSFLQFTHCQRRIQGGVEVNTDKVYAVYMVRTAPKAAKDWLCGGAIVTEWFIVTSAACVQNIKYTYVIAGYTKHVKANDLEEDTCTKTKKKKIVFCYFPEPYDFDYKETEKWTGVDIAVAKVETKYDFKDKSYLEYCSYIPGPINLSFDGKHSNPGTNTIILGWGHKENFMFEAPNTEKNHDLSYVPLLIVPKIVCKKAYKYYKNQLNIDKYMICADGAGNLDIEGDIIINNDKPKVDGCVTEDQKLKGIRGISCEYADPYDEAYKTKDYKNDDLTRRDLTEINESSEGVVHDEFVNKEKQLPDSTIGEPEKYLVRRAIKRQTNKQSSNIITNKNNSDSEISFDSSIVGPCQNDHGGPLVTWVGGHEILIGVITTFITTSDSKCKGPYLFTSTQCNSKFLDCVINYATKNERERKLCHNSKEIELEDSQTTMN